MFRTNHHDRNHARWHAGAVSPCYQLRQKKTICRRASSICVGGDGPLPPSVSSLLASKPPNTKQNPLSLQASCDHVLPLRKRHTAIYIVM
jgi:hypothetical protein